MKPIVPVFSVAAVLGLAVWAYQQKIINELNSFYLEALRKPKLCINSIGFLDDELSNHNVKKKKTVQVIYNYQKSIHNTSLGLVREAKSIRRKKSFLLVVNI